MHTETSMSPPDVETSWAAIEEWLERNAPVIARFLEAGASEEALAALEAEAGVALPPAFVASWRRHDGTGTPFNLICDAYYLMRLDEILSIWHSLRVCDGAWARPDGYRSDWMPIAISLDQRELAYLALEPFADGPTGQVLADLGEGVLPIAPSLEALLGELSASSSDVSMSPRSVTRAWPMGAGS